MDNSKTSIDRVFGVQATLIFGSTMESSRTATGAFSN